MRVLWYSSLQGDTVMKRPVRFLLYTLMLLMMVGAFPVSVAAFDEDEMFFDLTEADTLEGETYFDVTDFGANGTDGQDDYTAINTALAKAAKTEETVTIYIPDGDYHISGSLFIYSNTILQLGENVAIYELPGFANGSMIIGSHLNEEGKRCKCAVGNTQVVCNGYGYSKCANITIDGGRWVAYRDPETGECPGSAIVAIRHAHDITLKNMTCCNASGHAVNLSGVDTALVTDLIFDTASANQSETPEKSYTKEFIHLDYCTSTGEPAYGCPYDNTPAKNISVCNCTFTKGYSGVGNHNALPEGGEISSNISIKDCTFTNMGSYAVGEYSVKGLTVENCKATDCMIFALINSSSDVKLLNNMFDAVGPHEFDEVHKDRSGINITQSDMVTIQGNTISNTTNSGISATSSSNIDITGNTCIKAGKDGIVVKKVNGGKIDTNNVSEAVQYGIEYRSTKGMSVSGNTISSTSSGLYIIGTQESGTSGASVTDNILNSGEGYDLYLGLFSNDCYFSGNKLVNYTMLKLADSYTGTIDLPVISGITFEKPSYIYTCDPIKPSVMVTDSIGRTLSEDKDYSLSYENNTDAGTAQVIVKGRSRSSFFDQEKMASFIIAPKAIEPRIELSSTSYIFTNKVRKPSVTVYDGDHHLEKDQYKVTYSKGRKLAGTYNVKVTLRKNYSGTGKTSFTITKAAQKISVKVIKKVTKVKYSSQKSRYIRASKLFSIKNTHGTRTFKLVKGKKKYFAINRKNGKITVKPGTPHGKYILKIKIAALGGRSYKPKSVTKTIRIWVVD